ncbi:hypothetical protein BT63DRAFT_71274 [Microthyrium microscopicum]|uniref:Uncharacterized protein n=1 Tax=Microthyrium microscopicum TaxID=703497 RepID=A0A6A6U2L7_9PEZI|nr:hypothetical protein BT63DRAFT_71274 [Microthyrium microscopicum]
MATAETSARPHDRHGRKHAFSSWMRRLATLKHNATNNSSVDRKGVNDNLTHKQRRNLVAKNNPYPESALPLPPVQRRGPGHSRGPSSYAPTMMSQETGSIWSYEDTMSAHGGRVMSTRSAAPTVATNPDTIHSDAGQSKAGTTFTAAGAMSARTGGNSAFSSPRQSQESLTTTLTTLQSTAPSGMLAHHHGQGNQANSLHSPNQVTYAPHPPHYIPPHLAPHPQTYSSAIANNMLTDNASVLTLASSSKRRRRHSLDTDASVRALAPSSLFGNSRESLPLSVLSSNIENAGGAFTGPIRPQAVSLANAERASVYSASGVVPVINSERNSYYAGKQVDGASIRSGLFGHGKTESISGSITGIASSPLASPKDATSLQGRTSRRNSDWQDPETLNWDEDEEDEELGEQGDKGGPSGSHPEGNAKPSSDQKGKGRLLDSSTSKK